MRTMWAKAKEMSEQTPPSRDRYVDFLRLFSISIVVMGHWLMAIVLVREGDLVIEHLLAAAPGMQYSTWVLQVMPIFFIVGGFANAVSWAAARRRGDGYAAWLQGRTSRLLRPTMVFAAVWVVVTFLLVGSGIGVDLLRAGTQVIAVPLWFLAVYIGVVALAPALIRLDHRYGWYVPVALFGAAAAVDWLHHGLSVPVVGWSNFLFVWFGVHQIGVRWQRGVLPAGLAGSLSLAAAGFGGLLVVAALGPYPVSMVGVPGAAWTNNLPPTAALMVLAVFQTGIMLTVRGPVSRWLARPRPWAAVIAGNGRIMSIYLWHMTAMVAVIGLSLWLGGLGLGLEPLTAGWWWSRLVWLAILLVPLAGLIALFSSYESNRSPRPVAPIVAGLGVASVMWGFASLALKGFVETGSASVSVLPAAAVIVGSWMLGVRARPLPRSCVTHDRTAGETHARTSRDGSHGGRFGTLVTVSTLIRRPNMHHEEC